MVTSPRESLNMPANLCFSDLILEVAIVSLSFFFFIYHFWISIVSAAVQKMYDLTLIIIAISVCHQSRASFTSTTLMIWHKSSQNIGYSTSIQPLNSFGVKVFEICHRFFGQSSRFESSSFNELRHVMCVFWIQITSLLFSFSLDPGSVYHKNVIGITHSWTIGRYPSSLLYSSWCFDGCNSSRRKQFRLHRADHSAIMIYDRNLSSWMWLKFWWY